MQGGVSSNSQFNCSETEKRPEKNSGVLYAPGTQAGFLRRAGLFRSS
jgi:hypothetical protein